MGWTRVGGAGAPTSRWDGVFKGTREVNVNRVGGEERMGSFISPKKGIGWAILMALFILVSLAYSAELKIGYIDSQRIFASYKGTADAQAQFDREVAQWERQAEQMRQEVERLRKELEAQSLLLSEEAKKEKEQALQAKYNEYQQFVIRIWGPNGEAVRRNAELTKPIIDKINVILEKIGKKEGYTFIFDAAGGYIVFAQPEFDLTDLVIEELNREAK